MPYDTTKDPNRFYQTPTHEYGGAGKLIVKSDTVDLDPYAKSIVVITAGNLIIIPVENADADTITFTAAPVGFIPPYAVRRVLATGSTAAVATVV